MKAHHSIIVADDDRSVRLVITQALSRQGYHVQPASTAASMWDLVSAGKGQILITDVGFPDGDALDMLPRLQVKRPDLQIIVMSARANLLTAVQAQRHHVFDYLPKPFELGALIDVTKRAVAQLQSGQSETTSNQDSLVLPDEVALPLMGNSAAMQTSFKLLARFAMQQLPVIILAEPGSGKEEVARTLHNMSASAQRSGAEGRFVHLPLSQLPPAQHHSQLFGPRGSFYQANGGTLFINDINLLSEDAQMHLVRSFERAELVPGRPKRLICGSQVDLRQLVEQGQFRDDLHFILSAALLRLPPLRERLEDVPRLVTAISAALQQDFGVQREIEPQAFPVFQSYNWPHNVKELEFLLRRVFIKATGHLITAADVQAEINSLGSADEPPVADSLGSAAHHHIARYFTALGDALPPPGLYERVIQEVERPLIKTTLKRTAGNQIKAAEILGLNRNTLRKKMKLLNLSSNRADYRD